MPATKAVLKSLEKGALSPDQIRTATGNASRSLGNEGKKKGVTTTLPLALGQLQSTGNIRRVPVNGRLDQQRYQYALWNPSPLDATESAHEAAYTELARRFFKWIGPATLAEFQWFSGLGVKAAAAAIAPIKLIPLATEIKKTESYVRDQLEDARSFSLDSPKSRVPRILALRNAKS